MKIAELLQKQRELGVNRICKMALRAPRILMRAIYLFIGKFLVHTRRRSSGFAKENKIFKKIKPTVNKDILTLSRLKLKVMEVQIKLLRWSVSNQLKAREGKKDMESLLYFFGELSSFLRWPDTLLTSPDC